jgi:hypothetical protein
MVKMVVFTIIANFAVGITGFFDFIYSDDIFLLAVALPYGLAYLGNMLVGPWGLITYIQEEREEYPGTCHLLNWIYLFSTLLIVLTLFSVLATDVF